MENLSAEIMLNFMVKLDVKSLQNILCVNKSYYQFCRQFKVWKIKCQQDFPELFKELRVPLNEPNWQRVYFYLAERYELQSKISWPKVEVEHDSRGYILFCDDDMVSVWNGISYDRVMASMVNLGAYFHGDEIRLSGRYKGKYDFIIDDSEESDVLRIYLDCYMDKSGRQFQKMIMDIRKYLLYTEPKPVFNYPTKGIPTHWHERDDVFVTYLPSFDFYQPYEFYYQQNIQYDNISLYISKLLSEKEIKLLEPETIKREINKITHKTVKYVMCESADIIWDYFSKNNLIGIEDDIDDELKSDKMWIKTGIYHGTMFVLYAYLNDQSVYLKVPTQNPQPLIDYLLKLFNSI